MIAINKKISVLIAASLCSFGCRKTETEETMFTVMEAAVETYRVTIKEYGKLERDAIAMHDVHAANAIANHFTYTEIDEELADFWVAIAARNGSSASKEILKNKGIDYNILIKNSEFYKELQHKYIIPKLREN
jgi:hypothetical protein